MKKRKFVSVGSRSEACTGKIRHETLHEAMKQRESMRSNGAGVVAYKCHFCHGYHVGNLPEKMARGRSDRRGNW